METVGRKINQTKKKLLMKPKAATLNSVHNVTRRAYDERFHAD